MVRMEASDAAQVAQALAGDQDAFRALVERHSGSLFRLAYRMTGNEHDAEEVVQETFLRAYRRLNRFELRASFGTWIYRIGVNCSLDLMRKVRAERRQKVTDDSAEELDIMERMPSEDPAPDRLLLSTELRGQVAAALDTLSATERAAFVLRHFEGRSIEEIGKTLGLRASATKNSVFRAVRKLRHALEPHGQSFPSRTQ